MLPTDPAFPSERTARRWLAALVVLALALRLPAYLGWWFNPDEAIYLEVATTSAERARAMVENNAHPPLQYALLRALARVSTAPQWLRAPSLAAGVALVALVYAAVRRLSGVRAALAAAALVAVSPSAVVLSGVMRPYALQQAALALALLGWAGWLAGEGRSRLGWLAVGLGAAVGLHYSSFAALAAFGAALVALRIARRLPARRWLELAGASAVPAALAAWLYVTHVARKLEGGELQAEAQQGWLEAQFASSLGDVPGRFAALFKGLFGVEELALAFGFVALVLSVRARRSDTLFLPLAALAAAFALSFLGKYPLGGSRHSAWLLVFLAPAVGEGLACAARARARPLALAGALAAVVLIGGSLRGALRLTNHRPLGEFLPEGAVRPAEARAVAAFLRDGLPADALLVSDHQTLNLLRAAVGVGEPRYRRKGDGGLARAVLGEREYYYPPLDPGMPKSIPWELPWQRSRAVDRVHVAGALAEIDARPQLANRARAHGVWIALGGWSPNLANHDPTRAPDAPPLYSEVVGGPGLGLFRLDRAVYEAYLAGD